MTKMKRKFFLMLPVLIIPFLTLIFWSLGGGKEKKQVTQTKGLNLQLPDAHLKEEKGLDKLSFYEKADKDSMKLDEWMRSDPYFKRDSVLKQMENFGNEKYSLSLNSSPYEKATANPEAPVMQKLQLLERQLSQSPPVEKVMVTDKHFSSELDRLENMLSANNSKGEDEEMRTLQGTLDRILDIQHPQRVKERSLKNKEGAYAVRTEDAPDSIVKGFYSYSDKKEGQEENVIDAIIAGDQIVVNNAVVKFRTVTDIYVNGKLVPKNTVVSGIANLQGERLAVEITSIRCGKRLYNVKLEVYDMDGLPGIYIPGTINRDVAKETLNNSLSLADMTTLDPSLKAQVTATGIGAIKSLVSRKVKLVRVQVKAGYKVLFKNKNPDQ